MNIDDVIYWLIEQDDDTLEQFSEAIESERRARREEDNGVSEGSA